MNRKLACWIAFALILRTVVSSAEGQNASPSFKGPVELRVDDLHNPLGIDDPAPCFSWQLQDAARGANQSAYEVLVSSTEPSQNQGKPDIWDSGRIQSDASLNIRYAGPALEPSHRYFWRVKLWDAAANTYSESESSWWETGLLQQQAWQASWIGYETPEEAAVRHAPAAWIASPGAKALAAEKGTEQRTAYRQTITLDKAVKSAALYATGRDTVSAWVNGAQLLTAAPFPPYKQMPWKKFVRADATTALTQGSNSIAIETLHYVTDPAGAVDEDAPPMVATLVVEYADGTTAAFATDPSWKSAINAARGWTGKSFDDSAWKPAVAWSQPSDPDAKPIGHPWIPDSVKALRHPFEVKSPIKSARIYATALGAYELFLNGNRVGNDVLDPGWTDYREHVKYQTYDVTSQLSSGPNSIEALLAPGWYETPLEWYQQPNNYGDTPPALRAQLRIEYTDGTVQWVATGPTWQASPSYIVHSEIYDGETQNYALMQPPGFSRKLDQTGWNPVIAIAPKPIKIEAQDFQSIRVERTLTSKTMTEPKPGVYVYDFGQNFSGVEHLSVRGPAGTDVRVRFAEILNADGTLYTDNLRTAKATDHFILLGGGQVEELLPQFTFHGFRYLEITGLATAPAKEDVTADVFHTDAAFTAKLETGSPLINQLWSNILWGQRSNFVGIPTDCPQRDERLGWMGDAEVFWRTAAYNMDLAAFSRKFGGDMRGTQVDSPYFGIYSPGTAKENTGFAAGWSDAGVIIPWTSWLQTGDTSVIDQNWPAMEKYLAAIEAHNPDGLWVHESGIGFGDWLSPEGKTDYGLIATAYWAYDATLMRQMAHSTGRTQDEEKYARLFDKIRAAFQKKFVHNDGFIAGADNGASHFAVNNPDAASHGGDTQTGYVLALHMNLVPEALRAKAAQKLADKIEVNHGLLATGFLGTPYLLEELTKTGHTELAYKLLLNTQYPSWGYLVDHGATTMWERWNGDQMKADPSMNSYNHYAYGAVADWIYRYAAGIDATPLDAGFHTVVLHPVFDARLGSVNFDYASSYGPIHSDWKIEGSTAGWRVSIPANTRALLELTPAQAANYKLEGALLTQSKLAKLITSNGQTGYELDAGSYSFQVSVK
jgi:alpha-L-rhamnosidase